MSSDREHEEAGIRGFVRSKIRPIALTVLFPGLGFAVCFLLSALFSFEIPRLASSVFNWIAAAIAAFFLLPRILKIPFGKTETASFNKRVGFYLPAGTWKHVLLGAILAMCTLSGMLAASILSGRYEMNLDRISPTHLMFCLNPGIWEEFFYRGLQVIILIRLTGSIRKAVAIQVAIFSLAHIKGFDSSSLIDTFSVMILTISFTYTAYKTRTLVAGIVFHYLHDAFVLCVQIPSGDDWGASYQISFYGMLWAMIGLGCLITKIAADKFQVRAPTRLYALDAT